MKIYKILHTATHTTNIGDGALNYGIQTTLKRRYKNIDFTDDCLMDYENFYGDKRYSKELIEKINKFDLLIIGGGGMIEGGRNLKQTGLAYNLPLELLKKINIPIVFYALGFNKFDSNFFFNKNKFKVFLDYVKRNNKILFSLRNDGSLERLKKNYDNLDTSFIHVIPDPGFFIEVEEQKIFKSNHRTKILVQLAGDNLDHRFNKIKIFKFDIINKVINNFKIKLFCKKLANVLIFLSKKYNSEILLAPHLIRDLNFVCKLKDSFPNKFIRKNISMSPVMLGKLNAKKFFSIYKESDLIIGMRGHSVICGTGLKVPTIGLSSHPKVKDYFVYNNLKKYLINMSDKKFDSKIIDLTDEIFNDKEKIINELNELYKKNLAAINKFNDKILSFFNS